MGWKPVLQDATPIFKLDCFIADFYGVATRDINQAVKNNPDKFPQGYVFELDAAEKTEVVENFHNLPEVDKIRFSPTFPKAFTEKGVYMLATILKGQQAAKTTIMIIETTFEINVAFMKFKHTVKKEQPSGKNRKK